MEKKEKTWIVRGTICRCALEEKLVVLRIDSFQSGNAKAYRFESGKPWRNIGYLEGADEIFKTFNLYQGEEVTVWILEHQEGEEKNYFLKRIEEKIPQENDGEIKDIESFLKDCI